MSIGPWHSTRLPTRLGLTGLPSTDYAKETSSRLRSKSDCRFGSDSSDAAKPLAGSFQRIPRLRFGCVCVRFVG